MNTDTKNTQQALDALEALSSLAWEILYSQERTSMPADRLERAVESLEYIRYVVRNHEQRVKEN